MKLLANLSAFFLIAGFCFAGEAPGFRATKTYAVPGDGGFDYITFDGSLNRLYVSHGTEVNVLDADSGKTLGKVEDTQGVHGIAIVPALHRGFTTNGREATVSVFDTDSFRTLKKISVADDPDFIRYDAQSGRILVCHGDAAAITVIDPEQESVLGKIDLGGGAEAAVIDAQGTGFVNLEKEAMVVSFDPRSLTAKDKYPIAGCKTPTGLAIDAPHGRLFIGCRSKVLAVMDTATGRVITTLPIGGHVDAVAFDPDTRLIFSSNGEGTVSVIRQKSPDEYESAGDIQTEPGAKTMALDPKTKRLFLPTAELAAAPAQEGQRPRMKPIPGTFHVIVVERQPNAGAQSNLAGGPYTVNVGAKSATVGWVVETGHAALGTSPDSLDKAAPSLQAHTATFTGLKPGTTYYYNVTGTDEGKGSFKTAPRGDAPFQFVVYGDTRTRHDVHRRVIAEMLKVASPDLALHTGDLVANGADSSEWPVFFDIERELLRKTAFVPALGNHERNDQNFYRFFDVPATPYYSFNWGSAHFIVLDSDIDNVAKSDAARESFWSEQVRWLEDDLKKTQTAGFRFVFAHHPPMTAVARRQGDNPQMTALMPLFEKYKVTAGFFGHDHNYQHYLSNGVHYFITGGGGAPLYDVDRPPEGITRKVSKTENFVVVDVKGNKAHVRAFTPDGEMIDITDLDAQPLQQAAAPGPAVAETRP